MPMVKINMMCGSSDFGSDWLHIDRKQLPHVKSDDIFLTGMYPVELIYCSHGIAYFDREEVIPLLQSWYNALTPGGVLQISTPDWDVLRTISQPLIGPLYGKINNPLSYHKTVYSYHDLYTVLRKAGFIHIGRKLFNHDDQALSLYDGKLISLNIECSKPYA